MTRSSLALVALVAVTVALPAAASSSVAGTTVLKTRGYVTHIAADGNRVAATTNGIARKCDRIVVWNPVKKAIAGINTSVDCYRGSGGINELPELAIAGKRVAWLEEAGGNSLEMSLQTRVLGAKKTTTVAYVSNGYGAEQSPDGDWVWNVVGHGSLLAYNRWSVCTAYPAGSNIDPDFPQCEQPASGKHQYYILSEQKLLKVVGQKSIKIVSLPDIETGTFDAPSLAVVSVDAGRIVTQAPSGQMTLYAATGKVLKQIPVPADFFSGTVLQGSQLVTLRYGLLELYNADTGALVKTIPVADGSLLRDLQNGLAVYVNGRTIHVLRLADGKSLTITPPGNEDVDAQIEASGLFYSYNFESGRDRGRIVFLPFGTILKKLG